MHKPLLIAHRGDSQNFPENTMAAFKSAFQKNADGIELDIHERSGELIVVHKYNYDRSVPYPILAEVLEEFVSKGRLEIEIKTIGLSFLEPLKIALEPYSRNDIELTTSVVGLFAYIRPLFPDFKLGCIFTEGEFEPWMFEEHDFYITKVIDLMNLYQADVAHLPTQACTKEMVKALHQEGKLVHTNLAGQTDKKQTSMYDWAAKIDIDQVTFDYMGLL